MSLQAPVTRYARNGPVHIAYQAVGTGPADLVYIPGIFTHVEHQWEEPSYARLHSYALMLDPVSEARSKISTS